jgi:hypothetical protein
VPAAFSERQGEICKREGQTFPFKKSTLQLYLSIQNKQNLNGCECTPKSKRVLPIHEHNCQNQIFSEILK